MPIQKTQEMWIQSLGMHGRSPGVGNGNLFQYSCLEIPMPVFSSGKESTCNAGDTSLFPGPGRSPGEGNGNLLQYSCMENPMDGGAWWATVRHDLVTKQQLQIMGPFVQKEKLNCVCGGGGLAVSWHQAGVWSLPGMVTASRNKALWNLCNYSCATSKLGYAELSHPGRRQTLLWVDVLSWLGVYTVLAACCPCY